MLIRRWHVDVLAGCDRGKYSWFLLALFMVGCGSATLETAANPFIAQFGADATSERRLNFSQAFNPPGTITGVLIGTFFIFSGIELSKDQITDMKSAGTYASYLHCGDPSRGADLCRTWQRGVAPGGVDCIGEIPRYWLRTPTGRRSGQVFSAISLSASVVCRTRTILLLRRAGQYLERFHTLHQAIHCFHERAAALLLTLSLVAFGLGRVLSTWMMRWFSPAKMIATYALVNIGLVSVGILHPGIVGVCAILLTSFFMSIMFPTIFALGVKDLGPNTKIGGFDHSHVGHRRGTRSTLARLYCQT